MVKICSEQRNMPPHRSSMPCSPHWWPVLFSPAGQPLAWWCDAHVRSLAGLGPRCSNPARNFVAGRLLCTQHATVEARRAGGFLTITLQIEPDVFEEEAATTLVLANRDGVVIGHWAVEATKGARQ